MAVRVALLTSSHDQASGLAAWINNYGDICHVCYGHDAIGRPDLIVSYNYNTKVPGEILRRTPAINLHIGYLPWNKGAHPVLWSAMQETPMGVTIHWMDDGIDTGQVITRGIVRYGSDESLRTVYDRCHATIQRMFHFAWHDLRETIGNRHYVSDLSTVQLPNGWDTTVAQLQEANNASAEG